MKTGDIITDTMKTKEEQQRKFYMSILRDQEAMGFHRRLTMLKFPTIKLRSQDLLPIIWKQLLNRNQ